jgi:hypothetical protein
MQKGLQYIVDHYDEMADNSDEEKEATDKLEF